MDLVKINGNTYYIKAPTNAGVYLFNSRDCLLIDTCFTKKQAHQMDKILKENNFNLRYIINTHTHLDHCRGNLYFQEVYPECKVFASEKERPFMEHPYLLGAIFFSASPLKHLDPAPLSFPVDQYLEPGIKNIGGQSFKVVPLPGHTRGQIGIVTPDRVCFLGDSIFSKQVIMKYSLPYLFDLEESIKTLHSLPEIDADYFLISHEEGVIASKDLPDLVNYNLANIEKFQKQILASLKQPLTREQLVKEITLSNNIALNLLEYHVIQTTVSAFLTHLNQLGLITYTIDEGRFYFQQSM
ncbi:MAG: MBL fold metallo-hydrolase [Syntrophomonadaceae bacterium]|jgi:glyoxylase-like metal-dependent hydrolase (beta-lactamase superfamily II)|nr:MBL fold metallo-hydrolase [Thermoanaerobacterales bacterium]NLN22324.1 MBL fold metallo-hydrolase [Syntrophomonadaceae bacterium]